MHLHRCVLVAIAIAFAIAIAIAVVVLVAIAVVVCLSSLLNGIQRPYAMFILCLDATTMLFPMLGCDIYLFTRYMLTNVFYQCQLIIDHFCPVDSPSNGGDPCKGPDKEWRVCNPQVRQ